MLEQLKSDCESLAKKKNMVRAGLEEMIRSMSAEVAEIESDFFLTEKVATVKDPSASASRDVTYYLRLDTKRDAYFEIRWHVFEDVTERIDIKKLNTAVCCEIALSIPAAISRMEKNLAVLDTKYQKAIEQIKALLDRLKKPEEATAGK